MRRSWKALLVSSLALGAQAGESVGYAIESQLVVQRFVDRSLEMNPFPDNRSTNVVPHGFSARKIYLQDIIPTMDSKGQARCCPPGTINDGNECVFPAASVCPEGSWLDGHFCISSPICPDNLKWDGKHCISPNGPRCPEHTKPDRDLCISTFEPDCGGPSFFFEKGRCVSVKPPTCDLKFEFRDGRCWSETNPVCKGHGLEFSGGVCIDPAGPQCPKNSTVHGDGICIGDAKPTCENPDYELTDKGLCRHTGALICEKGKLVGNQCVGEDTPKCKEGDISGDLCVQPVVCDTEQGFELVGDMCTKSTVGTCEWPGWSISKNPNGDDWTCCLDGLKYDGVECVGGTDMDDRCPGDSRRDEFEPICRYEPIPATCTDGEPPVDGKCQTRAIPDCKGGKLINGKCILKEKPTCVAPSKPDGDRCVIEVEPICPGNSRRIHGECIAEGDPVCPTDFRLENDACISNKPPQCKAGYHLEGGECRHPDVPVCDYPNRLQKDKSGKMGCAGPGKPICQPLEKYVGGKCVSTKSAECKDKTQRMINGQCVVPGDGPECDLPLVRSEGKCIYPGGPSCPKDHTKVGNECIADVDPRCADKNTTFDSKTGKSVGTGGPVCSDGTEFKDNKCQGPGKPECPEKHTLNDSGKCVADKDPECPEHTKLVNGQCVLVDPPRCPDDTELEGGKCVARTPPKCDSGLEPDGKTCISKDPPKCGTNMAFDVTTGRCIVSVKRECFNMEVCPALGAPALPAP